MSFGTQSCVYCQVLTAPRSPLNVRVTGCIWRSVSTVNCTYEFSWVTYVSSFLGDSIHSTGPSTYESWVCDYRKFYSSRSVITVCTYGAQWNDISSYERESCGPFARIRTVRWTCRQSNKTIVEQSVITSQSKIWCVPTVTECDPVCPNHVYMWAPISVGVLITKSQSKDWYQSHWTQRIIMNKNSQPMDHYRFYNLVGQQVSTLVANCMASRINHSPTLRFP